MIPGFATANNIANLQISLLNNDKIDCRNPASWENEEKVNLEY